MPRAYLAYSARAVSLENGLRCIGPGKTVQSQKEEADINTIVRNFGVTGKLPQGVRVPSYGDFYDVEDYRTAIDAVRAAEASFKQMPAHVRDRFQNDPQLFVEFCEDSRNLDEMRKLGLAVPAEGGDVVRASDGAPVGTS